MLKSNDLSWENEPSRSRSRASAKLHNPLSALVVICSLGALCFSVLTGCSKTGGNHQPDASIIPDAGVTEAGSSDASSLNDAAHDASSLNDASPGYSEQGLSSESRAQLNEFFSRYPEREGRFTPLYVDALLATLRAEDLVSAGNYTEADTVLKELFGKYPSKARFGIRAPASSTTRISACPPAMVPCSCWTKSSEWA